jgi:hypothetical protein
MTQMNLLPCSAETADRQLASRRWHAGTNGIVGRIFKKLDLNQPAILKRRESVPN